MSRLYRTKKQARLYWQGVLEQWRQSDLSVPQFCREHQISDSGFYTWRKKLSMADPTADPNKAADPSFVQIDMHADMQSPMTLKLVSGHTLQINNQVNADSLAQVLRALHEANLC